MADEQVQDSVELDQQDSEQLQHIEEELLANAPETVAAIEGTDETASAGDEDKKPKKEGVQSRIDELTRRRHEAEERELIALTKLQELQGKQDEKPKQEAFEEYSDFVEATSRWVARQEHQRLMEQQAVDTHQATYIEQKKFEQGRFMEAVESKDAEGNPAYGDFGTTAATLSKILGPQHEAYHALFESEQFPELVLHLASNLNEAAHIVSLTPRAQLREILRLEDKISSGTLQPAAKPAQNSPSSPRRISSAPAPVRTVTGGREVVKRDPNNEAMQDYASRRLAELRKRR